VFFDIFGCGFGDQSKRDRDGYTILCTARFKTIMAGQCGVADFNMIGILIQIQGIRILCNEVFFPESQEIIISFVSDQFL
jgi:hypothetical protein